MFSLCFLVALVCKSEEHFVRLSSCFTQSHILYMDKPLSAPRGPDDGGKKQKRPREASSGREGADKRGRRDGRRDGGRRGGHLFAPPFRESSGSPRGAKWTAVGFSNERIFRRLQ